VKRVIFSPEALADLEDVANFIARDNPPRALTFVAELRRKAGAILRSPNAYPPRSSLQAGLRLAVYRKYNIYFRIAEHGIDIVRVLHSARDAESIFRAKFDPE
jgi:toxin ParE1/3/4